MENTLDQALTKEQVNFGQEYEPQKNEAMERELAGLPIISETTPKIKVPDITTPEITTFSPRQQVMSNLHLMDEDFNYTDTYTNYVSKGGTPPPGFEYAHDEILKAEHNEELFKQVEEGALSYDTALMESYGKDIMDQMGYHLKSVGWWQQKFRSNDFTSPFDNSVLMTQVLDTAKQYHQAQLAKEGSYKKVSQTQLSNMIDKPLQGEEIRSIFGDQWDEAITDLSDTKLMDLVYGNVIPESLRIYHAPDNTIYYLHNDGQLYKVDGQSGEGHASFDKDASGNITGIYIGGKGETHFNAFTSGVAGVFTSMLKFVGNGIGTIGELLQVMVKLDDNFDWNDATAAGQTIDRFLNKNINWANQSGYIDLDQNFSLMDLTHFGANLFGSVAGVMTLGAVTQGMSSLGEGLKTKGVANARNITLGEHTFNMAPANLGGNLMNAGAKVMRWQTGNFGNVAAGAGAKATWLNRLGTASVYNTKDFLNNVQTLAQQRAYFNSDTTDAEIFVRAGTITLVNTAVDTLISGGIDDNTYQAWTGRNANDAVTKEMSEVISKYRGLVKQPTEELKNALSKYSVKSNTIVNEILKNDVDSDILRRYLKSNKNVIRLNASLDFMSNFVTGFLSSKATALEEDGELKKFTLEDFNPISKQSIPLFLSSAFNAWKYSYKGQVNEYNIAFDNISKVHTRFLDILDKKIAAESNIDNKKTLIQVRQSYVDDFKNSSALTAEGQILDAMSKFTERFPTDNRKDVPEVLKSAFDAVVPLSKAKHLQEMYDASETLYLARLSQYNESTNPVTNTGLIRKSLTNLLLNKNKQNSAALGAQFSEGALLERIADYSNCFVLNPEVSKTLDEIHNNIHPSTRNSIANLTSFGSIIDLKANQETTYDNIVNSGEYSKDQLENMRYLQISNNSGKSVNLKAVTEGCKLAESLGLITLVDKDTNTYAYIVNNEIEDINMSEIIAATIDTQVAISKQQQSDDITDSIKKLLTVVNVSEKSAMTIKATATLKVLGTLEESGAIKPEQAASIFNKLVEEKYLPKSLNLLDSSGDKVALDNYNKYKAYYEVFKAATIAQSDPVKFKNSINLSDENIRATFEKLIKDKDIPQELKDVLIEATKESSFQSGDSDSLKAFLKVKLENEFADQLGSPRDDIKISGDEDIKTAIRLYAEQLGLEETPENKHEVDRFVEDVYKTWTDVYKNSYVATVDDDILLLDVRHLNGYYTEKLFKAYDLRGSAKYKETGNIKDMPNRGLVDKEFSYLNNLRSGNSYIIPINLKSQQDINFLNSVMKHLNYTSFKLKNAEDFDDNLNIIRTNADLLGVVHNDGKIRVVSDIRAENFREKIFQAYKDGYIEMNGKIIRLDNKVVYDHAGNKTDAPDVVSLILSEIDIKNINPNLHIQLNNLPILSLLPFMPKSSYNNETVITTLLKGTQEIKTKAGKLASQSEAIREAMYLKGASSVAKIDKPLANYFATVMLIDYLYDNQMPLRVTSKEFTKLRELGIIDSEDSYWKSYSSHKQSKYIVLKDTSDEARIKLKKSILDKDFNILKVFPVIGYKTEEMNQLHDHGFINQLDDLGIELGDISGNPRKTAISAVNVEFPWDDENRTFAKEFFTGILEASADGTYKYNPIGKNKFEQPDFGEDGKEYKLQDIKDFKAYKKFIKSRKDPYSILMKRYLDAYENIIHASKDSKDFEDWRLLTKNRDIINVVMASEEFTPEVKQQMLDAMSPRIPVNPEQYGSQEVSSQRTMFQSKGTPDSTIPVGEQVLASILGGWDNFKYIYDNGDEWKPTDSDLQKVFKEIKNKQVEITEAYNNSYYGLTFTKFVESDVAKLFSLAAAGDGYFRLDDIEELAQLLSSNYNEAMEKAGVKLQATQDKNLLNAMTYLYGKKANSVLQRILNQAESSRKLHKIFNPDTLRKVPLSTSPNIEIQRSNMLSKGGKNLNLMNDLKHAYAQRQAYKNRLSNWDKLSATTTEYDDYKNINSRYRATMENAKLFEEQHGNYSKAYTFTQENNATAPVYTTIRTYNKLQQDLKTIPGFNITDKKTQSNLMKTAMVLTNMFLGRNNYAGKSTKYVFIDRTTGELLDMEDFTAENFNELFSKVVNNKTILKNSIILTADNAKVGSTSELNVKYKDLGDSGKDYNTFVTELYHNWIVENEATLKKALNVDDLETVMNLMGKNITNSESIRRIIETLPNTYMSDKEEYKLLYDNVKPFLDMGKVEFYKLMKGSLDQTDSYRKAKDNMTAARQLLGKEINQPLDYENLSDIDKARVECMKYGLSPELLTVTQQNSISDFQREILGAIRPKDNVLYLTDGTPSLYTAAKDYFRNPTEVNLKAFQTFAKDSNNSRDLILSYIAESDTAATIDLIARGRSLKELYSIRHDKQNHDNLVVSDTGAALALQDLKDLVNSMDNSELYKHPKWTTVITLDTEYSNKKDMQNNPDALFSFGIKIDRFVDGKWVSEDKHFNIKNDYEMSKYIATFIDMKDPFYLENKGYQDDVKEYISGEKITPEAIKAIIESYIDDGKTLFIGHNSDKADLTKLKAKGILTDDMLQKVNTIDTLIMAATNLNDERAHRVLKNTSLLKWLTNENNLSSAHGSVFDTHTTFEVFKELIRTSYDISNLRTEVVKDIEDFADKLGFKITEYDLNAVDEALTDIRAKNEDIIKGFNTKFEITTDSVSAIKDVFNYQLKKDYTKLIYEIKNKVEDSLQLSKESQNILLSNKYSRVFKLISYTEENNIPLESVLKAIGQTMEGPNTEDSILKVLGRDNLFNNVLEKLNIKAEDIENIDATRGKQLLSGNLLASDRINKTDYETYKTLKGTQFLGNGLLDLVNSLGLDNVEDKFTITSELLKFFDVDSSVENPIQELFKATSEYVESKYDKAYRELLESRFGDTKALFDIPQKGKYNLISSYNTGTYVYDLLSGGEKRGSKIQTDASMIILTRNYFEDLIGESLEDYKIKHPDLKELYTNMIIHPADGNNKILSRRILVVESFTDIKAEGINSEYGVKIPETIAETLVARDFDGDHVIVLQPEARAQKYLKDYCSIMFKAHDMQEDLLNWIKSKGIPYKDAKQRAIIKDIASDDDIVRMCLKADSYLEKGEEISKSMTETFRNLVAKKLKQYNKYRMISKDSSKLSVDDVVKELWVKTFDTSYYKEGESENITYINNPYITQKADFSTSYSAKMKQRIDTFGQTRRPLYTPIDQATGELQKKAIMTAKPQSIEHPLKDLIINNIYGADVIQGYFENIKASEAGEVAATLKNSFNNLGLSLSLQRILGPEVAKMIDDIELGISEGDNAKAFRTYDILLRTIEDTSRNYHMDTLKSSLNSEEMQDLFNEQRAILDSKIKGVQLLNELKKMSTTFPHMSDTTSDARMEVLLHEALEREVDKSHTQMMDSLPKNMDKVDMFVVVNMDDKHEGFPSDRDSILFNTKSKVRVFNDISVPFYSSKDIVKKVDAKGNEVDLKKGDFLPKGTALLTTKNGKEYILKSDAYVEGISYKNKRIYLHAGKDLDNQIKIIFEEGNKGPIDTGYYVKDNDTIDFIVNADTMKPEKFFTTNKLNIDKSNGALQEIILVDSNGKEHKVQGYLVHNAIPALVENDNDYKKKTDIEDSLDIKEGYTLDPLHHASDSRSASGVPVMGGWYIRKTKDGLMYDPTDVQNMISSIEHPERKVIEHNAVPALQSMKIVYLINLMDDAEIAKVFHTKLSKRALIKNKLSDVRILSEDYNSDINWLTNYLKDRIDYSNPIINRLFSRELLYKLRPQNSSMVSDIYPENITSKRAINKQATYKDGRSSELKAPALVDSFEARDDQKGKPKNYTELYISPKTLLNYLLQDEGYNFSTYQFIEMAKRGLSNIGRFYNDAEFSNQYKNTNVDYVDMGKPVDKLVHSPMATGVKTSLSNDPYFLNRLTDSRLEPRETPNAYLKTPSYNIENNKIVDLVTSGQLNYVDKKMLAADVLNTLGNIRSGMTKEEKLKEFSGANNLFTISQRIPFFGMTDDGMELKMTGTDYVTDTANNLVKKINRTVRDYKYMTAVANNPDREKIDFDALMKQVDTSDTTMSEYNDKVKKSQEALDNVYKILVDHTTGEVDDNVTLPEMTKDTTEYNIRPPRITKDHKGTLVFERDPLLMSSSGLKEQSSPEAMNVARAYKRMTASATYASQEPLSKLRKLQDAQTKAGVSNENFQRYTRIISLAQDKQDGNIEKFNNHLKHFGMTEEDFNNEIKYIEDFNINYPHVASAYKTYIDTMAAFEHVVSTATGQPLGCLAIYMSPYKPNDKHVSKNEVRATVNGILNIQKYSVDNAIKSSLSFDFYNSSKAIIQELSNLYGTKEIKDTLLNEELNLSSNKTLIEDVYKLIDDELLSEEKKEYKLSYASAKDKEETSRKLDVVMDVIEHYTRLDTKRIVEDNIIAKYVKTFKYLDDELSIMLEKFENTYEGCKISSYTQARQLMEASDSYEMRKSAEAISNYMWAKLICAQGLIESSSDFANKFEEKLNVLAGDGKSLVNAMGQAYRRGSFLKPISSTSMANIEDNLGIAYNSKNNAMWNQYMLEKIISGDVYVLDNKVVDYLDKTVYTEKVPSNTLKTLKNISKWSSALQMAIPSKLLNRLVSFTGFDYAMSLLYNPKSIGKFGQARRELLAAYQSKGASLKDNPILSKYFELEGQPIGLTGKDPITFTEDISGPDKVMRVLDTLTDPLEFQNHLGRYALYLTALESFEKGDGWYGPVYSKKAMIDSLPTNEDKAMYVMDYMLGSPGGFPILSKKTSGYMLYATFPMAFTRTLGAWAMSLSKLAQEGFTEANGKQWMRTAVVPSMGLLGITGLGALVTAIVCDLYGIEEEEKEEMLEDLVTIDPIGTLIGGTPTASSSSMNPLSNAKEMFITPFLNEPYQRGANHDKIPSMWQRLLGVANVNIMSHLNPAIKTPIEIATGKDFFGAAPIDTKYYYTGTENAIRKLAGFFIGSSAANAIVDQNKMDSYTDDHSFINSLVKGLKRGIADSVGNQKTYKKDTTNYYNNIYKVNNFKYSSNIYNDADAEDLLNAKYLEKSRNYNSQYGAYDYDDYKRISNILRKMINRKAEPAEVYAVITDEYNKGVSESTLRVVLDNNSLIRKINQIDTQAYLKTLSSKEKLSLANAIEYEERMYPLLDDFFPRRNYNKGFKIPYVKTQYYPKGGYGRSNYYPSYRPNYYPRKVYPTSVNNYMRYNSYRPKTQLRKIDVNVHPEMSIWSNDFNQIYDLDKKERYLDNPFYNSLSAYEKRQKGSDK